MRKLPLLVAGVLALALGVAGIAQAVNSKQGMKVSLSKNSVKKAKKKGVGTFTVALSLQRDPADPPFATSTTVVHFDKNLVFNYKKFPTCTSSQAMADAAACKKAQVGTGTAIGQASIDVPPENLTIKLYNGKSGQLYLHLRGATPLPINSVIIGKLGKDRGKYGYKLSVNVPANLQQPAPGVYAALTSFITKVNGSKKGKGGAPYIALKGCSGGKLNFGGDFGFTDGTSQSPTTTAKCKK
jgi:hypothetical protein